MSDLVKIDDQTLMHLNESEDQSMTVAIPLPDYTCVSEQKVMKSVKEVCKGFDYTAGASLGLADTDALASYTMDTMESIKEARKIAESSQIANKAAILSRFWYLADAINTALSKGEYGTAAVNRLATALHKSVPYVYQIRAVATKLTVVDCFLLGTRGLDTSHLRKLAQVKDDSVRRSIITAFIEKYSDTSDIDNIAEAKKQLVSAVNANLNTNLIELGTSDPLNGGTEIEVSEEYTNLKKQLTGLIGMLKKFTNGDKLDTFVHACEDFYITDSTPDAEDRLDDIEELVIELDNLLKAAEPALSTVQREVTSLKAVEVTKA